MQNILRSLYILIAAISVLNCTLIAYAQTGFDRYLAKDSTYRFNSSPITLDSLIKTSPDYTSRDTAFYNSYGKAEVVTLTQLMYLAVNNNPELTVLQNKIDASRVAQQEKGYLPDPMLEVETDDVMSDFSKVGMINFYASQMFPFPGKLGLETETAMHNKDMMSWEKLSMASETMNMVKQNFYDLYFNTKKLSVNAENQLLIKTFITAAESKYSVGKGMQQDVFKSQIELSRLTNEEFVLKQQRKNIYSALTKLTKTAIDDNTSVNFSEINTEYLLDSNSFEMSEREVTRLVDYAFTHRADLKVIEHKELMSKTDIKMAELNRMPDFNVKIGYKIMPFEEKNAFSFMVGINVPIAPWSSGKYDFAIQKSKIDAKTAILEHAAKQNEIKSSVETITGNLRQAKETMRYYYGVLMPQTENTLKSTQYSYENSMTGFMDLLDSYRMYQEAKLMYYESVTMYLKMIAELEFAAGLNIK